MKTLLFNYCFLLAIGLQAQAYYVVSVTGTIFKGSTELAPKDRLDDETHLRFVGSEAQAYVMSPTKGYFVLSGTADKGASEQSEFLLAVREALLPPSELKMTGIREIRANDEGIHVEDSYDLMAYCRGRIAYLDSLRLIPDPSYFIPGEGSLELTVMTAEDTFTKQFPLDGSPLRLAPLADEDLPEVVTYRVSYPIDYAEDPTLKAETFHLVPIHSDTLMAELHYLRSISDVEEAIFRTQIAPVHVSARYGKLNPVVLERLLDRLPTEE